jgi:drug/metabolite transporter (DMT)-like permease
MLGGVVILWSSGFIVARLVGPYVEPLAFVAARNAGVVVVLAPVAFLLRRSWPGTGTAWAHLLFAGALNQGVYLAAVYWSVREGLPAGVAALLGGFQPIAIALFAMAALGERINARRWFGIALGFAGAALVLTPRLEGVGPMVPLVPAAVCFGGILAIAAGTVWLRRFVRTIDLVTGSAVQFLGAGIFAACAALTFETGTVIWSVPLIAGYVWAVFALGAGGMTIYFWLMNRGAMAAASALLFLVPPTAALMAYVGFGEALAPIQLVGMGVAAFGVWMATRP